MTAVLSARAWHMVLPNVTKKTPTVSNRSAHLVAYASMLKSLFQGDKRERPAYALVEHVRARSRYALRRLHGVAFVENFFI